ncbi:hypothetical protein [Vibrio parahaemolyticus]|uniref:Uncharacterized protein n=1 Tax=Vibrio parahaemolyticus TaxID=670 RepID=A0AAX1G0K9_VIBPH|nr:hypothetical protein [Vibrio parahaemolyticus]QLK49787.1 hypothetical protein DR996_32950 [Vibrio owensii]OUD67541.1 hypothetical protein BTN34_22195 [Vibrio parahaemolyticus]OUD68385.1 hypothetical protein BTN60_21235 [Vibrio parahaemolyticus]QHH13223.1 hypothetical protein EHC69_28610 [Vibrio parahaemolyticus]QNE59051.1 hypothetical protein H5404_24560 [Vibrio parahaemolyticus]
MLLRSLAVSLVLVSSLVSAAQLTENQQSQLNSMNARLQTLEDSSASNIESLTQSLSSAGSQKDRIKINAQIKMNERRQQQAQIMLEQNQKFVEKVEGMSTEEVDAWQTKIEVMKAKLDELALVK